LKPFTERAVHIISHIPEGTVMTYGQIARLAGSPRGARQVVRILHSMSRTHNLPWHRVINSKGELAIKDDTISFLQKEALEREGVEVTSSNKVYLNQYQYQPDDLMNDVNII
jgi:methylated-DNA-protein-cysteine methyltransferase-like protein